MTDGLNTQVAGRLDEVAQILEEQGANRFRVRAYRKGAAVLRGLEHPVDELLGEGGLEALETLPGIGPSLARSIAQLVSSGRLPMLDRLRGTSDALDLLRSVPGIGRRTAERLHHDLGVGTLEELEAAAHDGRLEALPGLGPKRLAGIRESLAQRLGRVRRPPRPEQPRPTAAEILSVDAEYRTKAAAGHLPTIAPRRCNPARKAWLPILHAERGGHHYTALFSNTPRAHRFGTTRDWVVVLRDGSSGEQQFTVVTAVAGPLSGRRVVRGREGECAAFYADAEPRRARAG